MKRSALICALVGACIAVIATGEDAVALEYNDVGAHRFWRIIAKYHFGLWAINELQFLDRSGALLPMKRRDPGSSLTSGEIRSYGHSSFAFDGDESSYWLSGEEDGSDLYIGYDFGAGNEKEVVRQRVLQYQHDVYRVAYVELQYSDDGEEWTTSFNRPLTPDSYERAWEDSHFPCNDPPAMCGYDGTDCLNAGEGPFKEGHVVDFIGTCEKVGEGLVRGGATSALCRAGAANKGWVLVGSERPPSCGTCEGGTCVFQDGMCDVAKDGAVCNWVYWEPLFATTPLDDLPRLDIPAPILAAAAAVGGGGVEVPSLRCGSTYEVEGGGLSTDPVEKCLAGQIPSQLLREYEERGHVCVEGLLGADEVEALRPYLRADVQRLGGGGGVDFSYDLEEEAQHPVSQIEDSKEFLLAPDLRDRSKGGSEETSAAVVLTESARLLSAAATLMGAPPKEVCVWFDRAFFKEPGDSPTHWHRDAAASRIPETVSYVTAWVPLTAVDSNMGLLKFERGSHAADRRFDGHGPPKMGAEVDQRDSYAAGDVSFHHGHVKHASLRNSSPVVREVVTVMYAVYPRAGDGSTRCAEDDGYVGF